MKATRKGGFSFDMTVEAPYLAQAEDTMEERSRWEKSRVLGYVVLLPARLYGLLVWLLTSKQERDGDREATEALIAARDESDLELGRAVQTFLRAHPTLAPEKFGIVSERYEPYACFVALRALSMLLSRFSRVWSEAQTSDDVFTCVLQTDGTVTALSGTELLPASTAQNEISIFLSSIRRLRADEVTSSLYEHDQRKNAWIKTTGKEQACLFLPWIQAALRVRPDLMQDFASIERTEGSLTLTRIDRQDNEDQLAVWTRP